MCLLVKEGGRESVDVEPACVCAHITRFSLGSTMTRRSNRPEIPWGSNFRVSVFQTVLRAFRENPRMNLESCGTGPSLLVLRTGVL